MATLSRSYRTSSLGICGAFTYIDDWALSGRVRGAIIQKVTRQLLVGIYNGGLFLEYTLDQARQAFDSQNRMLFLDTMTYWEWFDVPVRGDIHGDQFQSNWFAPTHGGEPVAVSKGIYSITGEACFFATNATAASLGFDGSVPITAGLPGTRSDPSARLRSFQASNVVTRTVRATWDAHVLTRPANAYGVTQLAVS